MLQDIIRRATMNATTKMQAISFLSQNVQNYDTNSYKAKSFETFLDEAGKIRGAVRTNISRGPLMLTKNPLDVAIEGPGYFCVTKRDGSTAYTRDGRLIVDAKGYLTTVYGDLVGNGIKVPINYYRLIIDKKGDVYVREQQKDEPKLIGKIPLVNFANPGELKEIGQNQVVPTEATGEPETIEKHEMVRQYTVEQSNTDIWDSVVGVLKTNGSYLAGLKLVKYADEMLRNSANLKQ